jgi:hypothetical protein
MPYLQRPVEYNILPDYDFYHLLITAGQVLNEVHMYVCAFLASYNASWQRLVPLECPMWWYRHLLKRQPRLHGRAVVVE